MNPHLTMRSGNPALSAKTFKTVTQDNSDAMTINGTVNKTAMSLLLLMATASYTWINPSRLHYKGSFPNERKKCKNRFNKSHFDYDRMKKDDQKQFDEHFKIKLGSKVVLYERELKENEIVYHVLEDKALSKPQDKNLKANPIHERYYPYFH